MYYPEKKEKNLKKEKKEKRENIKYIVFKIPYYCNHLDCLEAYRGERVCDYPVYTLS